MMKYLFLCASTVLFSACATVMNEPVKEMVVRTSMPSVLVVDKYPTYIKKKKHRIYVPRTNKPIELTVIADSMQKTVQIEPRKSEIYWLNIVQNFGIGMWIERNNPKRYTYPTQIFVNLTDTVRQYLTYQSPARKNRLLLHVSLPHINNFYLQPIDESPKANTGFWGISGGLDFYYRNNRFVQVSGSGVFDFFIPVPAAVRLLGEWNSLSSSYMSLTNNHRINRFSFGYGLSLSKNRWNFEDFGDFDSIPRHTKPSVSKADNSVGLVFSAYRQGWKYFNLGLIYRPTFLSFGQKTYFKYEHLISVDFAWKIPLHK